jgi:hypothetical protein
MQNMKTLVYAMLPLLLGLSPVLSADPVQSPGNQAVAELGRLNGIALNCRYFGEVKRIKRILIESLPKRRELGQLFEDQTDASFKAFIKTGAACPSPAAFALEVDAAAAELTRTLSTNP